jgi:hypothetical protein
MDPDPYRAGVGELYAAEVFGEGLASRWLELSSNPDQKYKLALFLQLESEAKVRLRPLLARHGPGVVEDQRQRSARAAVAEKFAAMPWKEWPFLRTSHVLIWSGFRLSWRSRFRSMRAIDKVYGCPRRIGYPYCTA